jgi:proline iminopeptidase
LSIDTLEGDLIMTTKPSSLSRTRLSNAQTDKLPLIQRIWSSWINEAVVVIGVAGAAGFILSRVMPRGPVDATQTLIMMAACLAIGILAGLAMPSRWGVLLALLAHVIAYELGRMGAVGPTVDLPRLDSTYGILAFVLGRGFQAIVGLLPLVYGASLGGRFGRYLMSTTAPNAQATISAGSVAGWIPTALFGFTLIILTVLIALPASTPPILGEDGKSLPGSIAELTTVRLGGQDQSIMIRGHSIDNPVLLYLSGGPGQTDLPYTRVLFKDLEEDFVIVGWDQRGTGKSYAALDPVSTLTLDRAISDTIELADYLRARFDEEKIYLLGESWGSTLGVLAVQRQPDRFYAFIGSGQMVSQQETDRRLYKDVLDLAARTGDEILSQKMHAYGEPPYEDMLAYPFVMEQYERLYKPHTPPQAYIERGTAADLGPWGIKGSEYTLVEKVNVLRAALDMFSVMYPQIQGVDFRRDVPSLEVPVYVLDGEAELTSRRDLALEWYAQLQAPIKRIYSFENSAHSTAFEQFEAFHQTLLETILPETYPGR